ncbi:unnamed protein product [Plutella xylostella]|uniref:Ran-specific GTPase-activating protein n=1 Tax=Plutella xylostella TaxID=51655 RepID=A0A8S4G7M3_PLUXY|nr:unnamed protein product [Plutella xylostella]
MSSPTEETLKRNSESDTGDHDTSEHDPQFEPIVSLPVVEIPTNEEDEEELVKIRARLYRYDTEDHEWKERGTGDIKLLRHTINNTVRVVMRRDKTLKVCANHFITPDIRMNIHCGSDRAFNWSVFADFADEQMKQELLAIKFGNPQTPSKSEKPRRTYASIAANKDEENTPTKLEEILSKQAEKLDKLLDQMGSLMKDHTNLNIPLKTEEDIETAANYLTQIIQKSAWLNTPGTRDPIKNHGRYNIPQEVRKKVLEKRRLRRQWQISRHPEHKKAFNKAAAELKDFLVEIENDTLQQKLESLNPMCDNEYSLWKTVKTTLKPQLAQYPLKTEDGSWARTDTERAEAYAAFLKNVFKPNEDLTSDIVDEEVKNYLESDLQLSPPLAACTPSEVRRTIQNLQLKKAPGFDLITAEVLRQLPKKVITLITIIFNSILRTGYFPNIWKVSQITMVLKAGKPPHLTSSYRPISLLPVLSKVFEKVLSVRLKACMAEKKLIPEHQFGFRSNHSTVEQVHRVCEKVRNALEKKLFCCGVFLDVQQAFDKVWHNGLLYKIKKTLPHNMFLLLKSYIENRSYYVKINDSVSDMYDIQAGVPQGSVLGPTLYIIYTSDVPVSETVMTATFADDTAVLASSDSPEQASATLQTHLNKIHDWMKCWKIKASAAKSNHITFTLRRKDCPEVKFGNERLPHKDTVKYLGFHLDRRQTWKKHIQKKRDELNYRFRSLQWLLGPQSRLSLNNKMLIYKSILKPVWTYGIQLWGTAKNSNIEILQRFQNNALRTIARAPWFTKTDEIHAYLEIPTVKEEVKHLTKAYRDRVTNHENELARYAELWKTKFAEAQEIVRTKCSIYCDDYTDDEDDDESSITRSEDTDTPEPHSADKSPSKEAKINVSQKEAEGVVLKLKELKVESDKTEQ